MIRLYILLFFTFLSSGIAFADSVTFSSTKDSLLAIWNNQELNDTTRLDAYTQFIWEEQLFNKSDSAFYFIEKLIEEAKEKDIYFHVVGGMNLMGIGYDFRGNYAKAIDYYTKSLKLSEAQGSKQGIAMTANNIGLIYAEQENYNKAIEYYKKSLKIKIELKDSLGIARSYNNLGLSYLGQGKYDQALTNYLKSLEINELIEDVLGIAMSLNNAGNVYFERKEFALAKEYYEKSLINEKKINNKRGISTSLMSIALVHYEQGSYKQALILAEDAFKIAEEVDGITEKRDAAKALWKIYKKQSRFADALQMHEKFIEIRDTILSEENQREIIQKEFQYNFEKEQALKKAEHEAELKRQEVLSTAEKEKQKTVIYAVSGGLVLVVIFSLVVLNRFKVIQKKNRIIQHQKEVVEAKSQEIMDSINYAKRLQDAILPPNKLVKSFLLESFIIYKPKDIVAGDFYFMDVIEENGKKYIYYVAADCTGHGVPGAMVSIVGANGLKRCIQEFKLRKPGEILDKQTEIVAENFSQSEERIRDGMDLALCCLEMENDRTIRVHYSGANNPLWIINLNRKVVPKQAVPFKQDGGFEIKANKQAIGYSENNSSFDTHTIELESGDTLYTFSDGFSDQFGGVTEVDRQSGGKKYKSANFKNLLISLYDQDMETQKKLINTTFEDWRGKLEQLDDVCIIGVRV